MIRLSILLILVALLTACGSTPATPIPNTPAVNQTPLAPTAPPFSWDTTPGTILFRADRLVVRAGALDGMNRLPLCTIYGDGYMVWTTGDQVLEARLTSELIRSFLDYLIREQRFYSIRNYSENQIEPTGQYVLEVITLRVNNEPRTISNFNAWRDDEFNTITERCTRISPEPVIYQPVGAWLTVQPIVNSQAPRIVWSPDTPIQFGELAAGGKPIWISGEVLGFFWTTIRGSRGGVQFIENEKAYQIGLQMPGVSRESPPLPAVTPTMPVVPPSITPTPYLTPTSPPARDAVITATPDLTPTK